MTHLPPELVEAWAALGPHGRRILLAIARRLALGAEQYGDFGQGRDWRAEANEELVDATIYLVAQTLLAENRP